MVQLSCLCAHCWCFRHWTRVSMGTLTGLWLCSPTHNKLLCTVYSDTSSIRSDINFFSNLSSNSSTLRTKCSQHIPPTNRCHDKEIKITLIMCHSLHQSLVVMLCLIGVNVRSQVMLFSFLMCTKKMYTFTVHVKIAL